MSGRRLCLVHLPSENEQAWRDAAAAAARDAGWRLVDLVPDDPLPAGDHDILVQVSEARLALPFPAEECVILSDDPDRATESWQTRFGLDRDAAIRAVALQYARAAELAASGRTVVDGRTRTLDLPGLGPVTREGSAALRGPEGPLAFYRTLPPAPGASVDWPTDMLLSTGPGAPGREETDLTGRRRLLRYGPYLELAPGRWTVDVEFVLTIDRALVELRFEWGTHHDVDIATDLITNSGLYALSLTKTWTEPAVAELRIWLDRAVFDGHLEVVSCRVTYAPLEAEAAPPTREDAINPG